MGDEPAAEQADVGELRISAEMSLPRSAVTETFGILAVKRAGKSNAAVVLAEEMHGSGLPWVAIDPKGDWWGIRAAGEDGDSPGLAVVVFGGQHGDVPLEPGSGRLLADLIAGGELPWSVLDVSEMTKADQRRFLHDFADRLYRRNTEPLHVFCEEADEYIPQLVRGESARVVGAFETLVKRGGFRGIGITLITQRSASLNKDVLTQVGTLILLRTTSPQDQKAVEGWIKYHAGASAVLADLPGLSNGEGFIYSPSWLGVLQRVHFRRRRTFDSGATPTVGGQPRPPARLADVDLAAIKDAMAATIEKAEAEDPKRMLARIRELERQLATTAPPQTVSLLRGALRGLQIRLADMARTLNGLAADIDHIQDLDELPAAAKEGGAGVPDTPGVMVAPGTATSGKERQRPAAPAVGGAAGPAKLSKGERAVLTALAQHGTCSMVQVALLTNYASTGGGFRNILGALRTAGRIQGKDFLTITAAGLAALGDYEPLPTGQELLEMWCARLGKAERLILTELAKAHPVQLVPEAVAEATGYTATGGGFRNALGRLRTLQLITGRAGALGLSDDFARSIR